MINIHNVRFGFATNSSSSHSIIMLRDGAERPDDNIPQLGYGWEEFTLASREEKLLYIAQQVRYNLPEGLAKT